MIALVPVKSLNRAKSRLSGALDADARARLMHDTLRRTIQALRQIEAISTVAVITRDADVSRWAEEWGALAFAEHADGLNESLREARRHFAAADALLVVPADLGWLDGDDIRAITALAAHTPCVVIAPDRHERGTNALLLHPPDIIDFCFGIDSAQKHAAQAAARGVMPQWYRSSTISLDVDEPTDLALYDAAPFVL